MPAFRTGFLYWWIPRNEIAFRIIRAAVECASFFRAFPTDFAVAIRARAIHFGARVKRYDSLAFGIPRTRGEFAFGTRPDDHGFPAFFAVLAIIWLMLTKPSF